MNNLQVFPYVCTEAGWSISDNAMAAIWMQLEEEGKIEHIFYDGSIRDLTGWLDYIKRPGVFMCVVANMDEGRPVHVAWLKDVWDGVAWAHHAAIGKYHRGCWEKVIAYWSEFPLRVLIGLTPVTNERAVKFLQKICRFKIVGEIPEICNLTYESRRVPGVVSYYHLGPKE